MRKDKKAQGGCEVLNELAGYFSLHPNLVMNWKKQAIESLPEVFSAKRERTEIEGYQVNEKRIRRLMRLMGLEAICSTAIKEVSLLPLDYKTPEAVYRLAT